MTENNGNSYTQKEMTAKIMLDIEKIFNKLDELQKDIKHKTNKTRDLWLDYCRYIYCYIDNNIDVGEKWQQ